ncbi:H-NS histone family protein [Marinibacterium anthonyi]|nr:H-NS histone family protein [Marinibacterium anthonyi]
MTDIDLSILSLNELKALEKDVSKAIQTFEERRKKAAMAAIEAAAREHGYALSELTAVAPKKKATLPPKYRHPENSALTWSGRGRKPAWLMQALENGTPEEDLLID